MAAFAGILHGTTTAMYDIRNRGIGTLPGWIAENGVGVMTASPGILRSLVNSNPKPDLLAGLKRVTFAGEASYGPDIEAARACCRTPASCGTVTDPPRPVTAPTTSSIARTRRWSGRCRPGCRCRTSRSPLWTSRETRSRSAGPGRSP